MIERLSGCRATASESSPTQCLCFLNRQQSSSFQLTVEEHCLNEDVQAAAQEEVESSSVAVPLHRSPLRRSVFVFSIVSSSRQPNSQLKSTV